MKQEIHFTSLRGKETHSGNEIHFTSLRGKETLWQ